MLCYGKPFQQAVQHHHLVRINSVVLQVCLVN